VIVKPPKKILQNLKNKKNKLTRQILDFKNILPELMAEYNKKAIKPTIKFYQGKKGFNTIQKDVLSSSKNILIFTNQTAETYIYDNKVAMFAHKKIYWLYY